MIFPSVDVVQSYLWLVLLCVVLYLLWFVTTTGTRYWQCVRLPYIEGRPFVGNFLDALLMRKSMFDLMDELYVHERVRDSGLFGISKLITPTLVLRDPELIKQVLIKDAAFFCNRSMCSDPHGDPIGYYNLLMIRNPAWKQLRSYLTPSLSLSKIKQMYRLLDQVSSKPGGVCY
uniref:Cytochrome P450 n=1 Tax=Anopheles culicifacies TaxID=139723 RepID=A0A182MWL8_9DIPT